MLDEQLPSMYRAFAPWFHLLTAPEEYAEEAAIYLAALVGACERRPETLLELGSGGGNNASHMKAHFASCTLVDLSEEMLALSRTINPECEHVQGDMRTVLLGRRFDCVFVHDAICYMTTEDDVRSAIATVFEHLEPGGSAVLAPDYTRESFAPGTDHGGHDSDDGRRGLRYLEWVLDPDPSDTTYIADYAYLVRDGDTVRVAHDRHIEGLFSRSQWLEWLAEAGFSARIQQFSLSDDEPGAGHDLFVATKVG